MDKNSFGKKVELGVFRGSDIVLNILLGGLGVNEELSGLFGAVLMPHGIYSGNSELVNINRKF